MSLAELLSAAGATLASDGTPQRYGAPAEERAALRDRAGIVILPARARLRVSGGDAADYLHRLTTQSITDMAPGQVREACVLEPKGKVLAHARVARAQDDFVLLGNRAGLTRAAERLARFVITEDVEIGPLGDDEVGLGFFGPEAAEAIGALGWVPPEALHFVSLAGGADHSLLVAPDFGATAGWLWWGSAGDAAELLAPFEAKGAQGASGPRLCGLEAFEAFRIRAGILREDLDFGPETLFNETQLEGAVSWTKGCYPGQEPVVMARHRGHPPRLLLALEAPAGSPVEVGAPVLAKDAEVGRVTSAAGEDEGAHLIASVRHAAATGDGPLMLADGRTLQARAPVGAI